ncbi:MAG: type II secretion system protein N [Macromonas sp.]
MLTFAVPRLQWPPVLVTLLLWLCVGLSLAYWGWRWWGRTPAEPVPMVATQRLAVDTDAVARGLGLTPSGGAPVAVAPPAVNHVLLGVVRDRNGDGLALIATDGQPAKAYRVGASLPSGLWLNTLQAREATLTAQPGGPVVTRLTLPQPPR